MFRTLTLTGLAALLAATALTAATPAQAQIGTIFSDPPPLRPPGTIPRGGQPQPQPQIPDDDEEVPELPPQEASRTAQPSVRVGRIIVEEGMKRRVEDCLPGPVGNRGDWNRNAR